MTDKASPDDPQGGPKGRPDLARFLQDWTALWGEELRAQAGDPEGMRLAMLAGMTKGTLSPDMSAAMDTWRSAMTAWADTLVSPLAGTPPSAMVRAGDRAATPRSSAVAVASDARDAEIERLARRVDELEARLAKLETPRRPRASHRS